MENDTFDYQEDYPQLCNVSDELHDASLRAVKGLNRYYREAQRYAISEKEYYRIHNLHPAIGGKVNNPVCRIVPTYEECLQIRRENPVIVETNVFYEPGEREEYYHSEY